MPVRWDPCYVNVTNAKKRWKFYTNWFKKFEEWDEGQWRWIARYLYSACVHVRSRSTYPTHTDGDDWIGYQWTGFRTSGDHEDIDPEPEPEPGNP